MKKQIIDLRQTGQFSSLFLDYISGDPRLRSFYRYTPDLEGFRNSIHDLKGYIYDRDLLAETILRQYKGGKTEAPEGNIRLLRDKATFTVCTGHQLCLLTGPLYFIYKILTTINLSESLKKKFPEYNFVPVFWMAGEDHDFEEINHVHLFSKKLEWSDRQGGAIGRYTTKSLESFLLEVEKLMGDSDNAKALSEMFRQSYLDRKNLSDATRALVSAIFGRYGLVVVDGDDAGLKSIMKNVFEDELTTHSSFRLVSQANTAIEKLGYSTQVHPREINLFRLAANDRTRIEVSQAKDWLPLTGEKFADLSPNVVTRPLYQQRLLPNLAYVGGPAEIAYWLQYLPMFDHVKIPFPVLMPRNFAMLFDSATLNRMSKLGISLTDVFQPVQALINHYVASISGDKVSFEDQKNQLNGLFDELIRKLNLVDGSLAGAARAEQQKNLKSLDELEKKMLRSFKQKNETAVQQLEKLKEKLFPGGVLQERVDNFIPYYLKTGSSFIESMKKVLDPFEKQFNILSEE